MNKKIVMASIVFSLLSANQLVAMEHQEKGSERSRPRSLSLSSSSRLQRTRPAESSSPIWERLSAKNSPKKLKLLEGDPQIIFFEEILKQMKIITDQNTKKMLLEQQKIALKRKKLGLERERFELSKDLALAQLILKVRKLGLDRDLFNQIRTPFIAQEHLKYFFDNLVTQHCQRQEATLESGPRKLVRTNSKRKS